MLIPIHNGVFSVPLHTLDSMDVHVVADDYLSIDGDDSRVISFGPQPQDGEGQDDTLPHRSHVCCDIIDIFSHEENHNQSTDVAYKI